MTLDFQIKIFQRLVSRPFFRNGKHLCDPSNAFYLRHGVRVSESGEKIMWSEAIN